MIYKFTSSRTIIDKLLRDFKFSGNQWVYDAIEWMGEALDFIGFHGQYRAAYQDLEVSSHRAAMPKDLELILVVEYQGTPLAYGSDQRSYNPEAINDPESLHDTITTTARFVTEADQIQNSPTGESTFSRAYEIMRRPFNDSEYYIVDPGWFKTSFEKGTIRVFYKGYPIDSCGFPMIPDNIMYKQALTWYILRQMTLGGWTHPQFNFWNLDQLWKDYCNAAGNDAMMPTPAKAETFKNRFVRLIPEFDMENAFYA